MILPPKWCWKEPEWIVERGAHTDADGWQYGKDFSWQLHPHRKRFDAVRRRRWTRLRTPDAASDTAAAAVVSDALKHVYMFGLMPGRDCSVIVRAPHTSWSLRFSISSGATDG